MRDLFQKPINNGEESMVIDCYDREISNEDMTSLINSGYDYEQIQAAINETQPQPAIVEQPPCPDCGSSFWIRTGTCHTCTICGYAGGCG